MADGRTSGQGGTGGRTPDAAWRPTRLQLARAAGRTVPDLIGPGLKVLFCGINPGLYSGAVGHHFARPGNRLWPALHRAGFTERQLSPFEEHQLLRHGLGVVNLVDRASAAASDLTLEELREGGERVAAKAAVYHPRCVAFLGVGAYRAAYGRPGATVGEQPHRLGGSRVWLLPNPSGLNASYQIDDFVKAFAALRVKVC